MSRHNGIELGLFPQRTDDQKRFSIFSISALDRGIILFYKKNEYSFSLRRKHEPSPR